MLLLFYDGVLSLRLKSLGMNKDNIGFAFALPALCYALCAPLVGVLTSKRPRRHVVCCSFFLTVIALLLFGPSTVLGLPQ